MSFTGPGYKKIIVFILAASRRADFCNRSRQAVSVRYQTYPSARSATECLNLTVGEPRPLAKPSRFPATRKLVRS